MRKPKHFHGESFPPRKRHGPTGTPAGRCVIKTALTMDAINTAARSRFRPLTKAVRAAPDVQGMVAVFQDPETGEIGLSMDVRFGGHGTKVLDYMAYYPYNFPYPFAAYLVPPDITVEEEVWLEGLIEELVAVCGNQGYRPRLEASAAVWNGSDFEISFDPKRDAEHWIG